MAARLLVLGIEGTAHTFAVAVVESDGERATVRSNVQDMHRPEEGGIHPRVAADHHARVAGDVVRRALAEAGVAGRDLDLVAFSRSPGLGPCLRVAATTARSIALALDRPLLGVNHCVAHLEIGRAMTPARDPVLLYASGGNTQVIAFHEGRYRVFGETLDVGVGNMLDKFARELGMPFPGGPKVEALAKEASGGPLVELPYTVMGMDVAFSGLLTAALARVPDRGRADVAFALQETAFAMLTEVTERALAHTGKDEVVLGGGVACNARLQRMVETMCEERGARSWAPPRPLLVDNGAMIAHLGAVEWKAGVRQRLDETVVDQRERTDDVAAPWRAADPAGPFAEDGRFVGAEAVVTREPFLERPAVRKRRVAKGYRHPDLDRRVASDRTRREARHLAYARRAGVRTPLVYDVDPAGAALVLERIPGRRLKEVLAAPGAEGVEALRGLGGAVARLHRAGLLHGDLTTSNAVVRDGADVVLLDFGLAGHADEPAEYGTDLHVLHEALTATHAERPDAFQAFLDGYRAAGGPPEAEAALAELERLGRYRGT